MSSIRPLATITLLAMVGVFLFMKINETETPLPDDIADWTVPTELEIGTSPSSPSFAEPINPTLPAASGFKASVSSTTANGAPPSFDTAPPAFKPAPPDTTAPPVGMAPETPAIETQGTAELQPPDLKVPDLPPLPTIPAAGSTADTAPSETSPPTNSSASVKTSPTVDLAPPPEISASLAAPTTPAPTTTPAPQAQSSLFSATRVAVQSALDRGELSQALLLLSDWYGDPSLTPAETQELGTLLSQLAGSVIYSTEHRLEPPHMVQAGETLQEIAQRYHVPWQLLAKVNGISRPNDVQPGQQLKVVRGPFSAHVDLSQRRLTLMLDRRYAGQFPLEIEPTTSIEEGPWTINQKLLTPGNVGFASSTPNASSDQKSIMLTNPTGRTNQIVVLRGGNATGPTTTDPAGRVLRLKSRDLDDVYDILSLGSQVMIRR